MMYIIISNHSPQKLVDEVNEYLAQGYKPQGGIGCTSNTLFQAMVNDAPKKIISEEFKIIEKGIVPGEEGPEYVCLYQLEGKEYKINLGKGLKNYSDSELYDIALANE